jgi:hypothetical protein
MSSRPAEAIIAVRSVIVYLLGQVIAQVGATLAAESGAVESSEAATCYDQWFTAGLAAMVTGFALAKNPKGVDS